MRKSIIGIVLSAASIWKMSEWWRGHIIQVMGVDERLIGIAFAIIMAIVYRHTINMAIITWKRRFEFIVNIVDQLSSSNPPGGRRNPTGFDAIFSMLMGSSMGQQQSQQEKEQPQCHVNPNGRSMTVNLRHNGQQYSLYVPYDIGLIHERLKYRYYLLNEDDTETAINQMPGVPFCVSAERLGGKGIIKREKRSGETICTFSQVSIPQ